MASTSVRLDPDLKSRLAAAARRAGTSPQALIREAIARTVEQSEQDAALHAMAEARWDRVLASGETIPWSDVSAWLEARARGEAAPAPGPRRSRA